MGLGRKWSVTLLAGFLWLLALGGAVVPMQLEAAGVTDFWGYGGPAAVILGICLLAILGFVAQEVSGSAIRQGASRWGIFIAAILVLVVAGIGLSLVAALLWG